MTAPLKLFLGLIAILIMAVVFYFVDWKGKFEMLESVKTEITKQETELQKIKQEKEELPKIQDRNRQLQAELRAVIQEQLTPESESEFVPAYIADIERLVEQQRSRMGDPDFIVESLTPDAGSSANKENAPSALSDYPTRGFQMQLSGRYASVVDFLRQLGALKLKRLVTVSKISLTPKGSSKNYSESPVLNVTLPITVYLRKDGGN